MRRYLRIVRYSNEDMCWPNPSMKIARRKILSMCCFQTPKNGFLSGSHVKINFHVVNNFTKKNTCKNMLDFRETVSLLAKLLKWKVGIISRRPSKAFSKSKSIPHTSVSLNTTLVILRWTTMSVFVV
jgi:hypothetical protein